METFLSKAGVLAVELSSPENPPTSRELRKRSLLRCKATQRPTRFP